MSSGMEPLVLDSCSPFLDSLLTLLFTSTTTNTTIPYSAPTHTLPLTLVMSGIKFLYLVSFNSEPHSARQDSVLGFLFCHLN